MNASQLTFPLPGNGSAILTLPQPVTPELLLQLERALAATRASLQRDACPANADAGQIEYESWLRQLCAVHQ